MTSLKKKKKGKVPVSKSSAGREGLQNQKSNYIMPSLVWIPTLIILLISSIIRFYAFAAPIYGDEAVYGILGKKAVEGAILYKEIYEMKPPLLFYLYGIPSLIFSWGSFGLRMTGLLLVLLNSYLIYLIARVFKEKSVSFLIACICFFFLNNAFAYAIETVAEHFLMSFVLSGYYLIINPRLKDLRINIFLAGFLIAGGAMVKQTAALYGLASILLVSIYALLEEGKYKKERLASQIIFLALGATTMMVLNFLPILIGGGLQEARYWLFEVSSTYTTKQSFFESLKYLEAIGGWVINYQLTTFFLILLSALTLITNYKKKYFPIFLILLIVGIINIFPGYRFYGQYWIPLLTIIPLLAISLIDLVNKLTHHRSASVIVPLLFLSSVSIDSFVHRSEYFASSYLQVIENSHRGGFPTIYYRMTEYLQNFVGPDDDFLMLGSQPSTYYLIEKFPKTNHIFPRILSRDRPQNKQYQQEAIEEMKNGDYEYILFSVTGNSWQIGDAVILDWYNEAFKFTATYYDPILAYNLEEGRYYNKSRGDEINIYRPNQIVAFKRK